MGLVLGWTPECLKLELWLELALEFEMGQARAMH